MKPIDDIEEICKKLKPVLGERADNLWFMYLAENSEGRRDLALEIDIIAEKVLKNDTLSRQEIFLPPPSIEKSQGSFLVGDVVYNQKKLHQLYLKPEDFIKQIGIFAITGEGKTNLAYLLALQLLKSQTPFTVIDWKRSWRNLLSLKDEFPELKQIQVYTIGRNVLPFLWNPFRCPPGADKELWISTIAEALEKSHLSGPGTAYYFNRIYQKMFRGLKDDFYPNFFDGLRELKEMKAHARELNWKQTALRIFQSFTMGNASKAFNTRNPIKLEDLLDKPVILELDLEMPKALRIFFSELILRWIHLYRLGQGETEKLKHVLFLEEVHNLFVQPRWYQESNGLENIYREIRAFGQGIVSITQHPSLLPVYLLGNCHTQIYLGLQHADDIRTARNSLFLSSVEESYPSLLDVGECIIKIKNRIDPCLVKVPLVPVKKGIVNDDWLRVNTPSILPVSYKRNHSTYPPNLPTAKYSMPNQGKTRKNPVNPSPPLMKLLIDIHENPISGVTQRYRRLKLNPKYGNRYKNLLISQGCIQPRKIITNKGWIVLFDLTQKGRLTLRDLGYETKFISEGVEHNFWKLKIAEYCEKRGLKTWIEKTINGRPDIIIQNGQKRAAIEIETGKSNTIANIEKALKAGFDEVICVATSKKVEEKIKKELTKNSITNPKVKITRTMLFDLD